MPAKYRVKKGDTLGKIARRFYGDPSHFPLIVSANHIANPDRLALRQELVIPDLAGTFHEMTGSGTPSPPVAPIKFKKNGADLEVELTCGEAQIGTYTLRLWSPDGMKVVMKKRGSYLDLEEDRYPLPGRAEDNDQRILQCRSRVWLIPGDKKYAVFMTVKQGGKKIGEVSDSGETVEPTVTVDLRARLTGA